MDDDETARRVAGGLTALAVRLGERLASASPDRNLVFSPLSVHAALSLLAAGAAGATLDELLAVLGAASRDDLAAFVGRMAHTALADRGPESRGPRVAFACGVWCDAARPFKPAYRAAVAGEYNAVATAVDFKNKAEEERKQINEWGWQATGKLINAVLPPGSVGDKTAVVVGNAIYFKSKWERPFNENHTQTKPFYGHDGVTVADVTYMSSRSWQHIAVHDGFKALKLKYRASKSHDNKRKRVHDGGDYTRYALVILLPDERDGLRGLVEKMASRTGFLDEHTPAWEVPVGEFFLPKFNMSCSGSVVGVLRQMGLRLPFSPELADLSDTVEDDGSGLPIFVSDVLHKVVIEVNEEGTEAAAATVTRMLPAGVPPPPVDFVADHPFAYFIVEEMSRVVVFAGHVVDPSVE
uniref:Serpin domain-containing protein n=1 Tax=Leersia perrieri TaxID=77586 RepID=A0A0D9XQG4_9ORYZ